MSRIDKLIQRNLFESGSEKPTLRSDQSLHGLNAPVGVRIRNAILVFNILWLKEYLELNCQFTF